MQIWNCKKTTNNCLKILIWEGLGHHLGRVWDGLEPLLGALGRLGAGFWAFQCELESSMGPKAGSKRPLRSILDRFCKVLEGFWKYLGRVWERISKDFFNPPPLACQLPRSLQKLPRSLQKAQQVPRVLQEIFWTVLNCAHQAKGRWCREAY